MLKHLYISSFIIIDEVHIDFESGMSVLTGETGAGKSIIIDALGQLCGNRASSSYIKRGCSKAIIEGFFDIEGNDQVIDICKELHIDVEDEIVISKEILNNGKSNIKINYKNASNNALKILMPYIIDIHSQFETQKLFDQKNHIELLDQYSLNHINSIINNYNIAYNEYKEFNNELKRAFEEELSDEQKDYLISQVEDIDECPYSDDDVEDFENELKVLQSFEKMNDKMIYFKECMKGHNGSLVTLKESLSYLSALSDINDFDEAYEKIDSLYYQLNDEYENILDIFHSYHFDEYRLAELQDIMFKINRLKRKYGFSMNSINEYKEDLLRQIDIIDNRDFYIHNLEKKVQLSYDKAMKLAQNLSEIRKIQALEFENHVMKQLKDLYLDNAIFKIQFEKTDLNKKGIDKVSFMISVNKGQSLSLLNETASGGEISRVMLAIKTMILQYNSIETIIFDEVDTGVSGKVASAIGDKMLQLSDIKQVICITHLPQVAAYANYHYCILKTDDHDHTVSSIHLLDNQARIEEIAKMLSGETISKEAIENAKILLNA